MNNDERIREIIPLFLKYCNPNIENEEVTDLKLYVDYAHQEHLITDKEKKIIYDALKKRVQ